ncbi:sensor histidine kinase [Pinirhizobacter soli]|uniref:sensor histidine kinase n=1 Tax=Pinirhizobacter soli TaxID=2786953 RepID=UPI00202A5F45|nr:sensor histidine kinase [Pinirhizobacter soli]
MTATAMQSTPCPGRFNAWYASVFSPRPDSVLAQLNSPLYLRWQAGVSVFWLIALLQVPLAANGFAWHWFAPTLASIAVYLPIYVMVFIGPRRYLPWIAVGMAVISMALAPFNGIAEGYLLTASLTLSYLERPRVWLGGTLLLTLLAAAWPMFGGVKPALEIVLAGGVVGGFGNVLYLRNVRKDVELRLSQVEVRRLATLAERERIGRDLHDLLGHTLSLVTLKSELARRLAIADPPRAQREMEEVERVSRHALAEVRAAVTGMRRGDLAAEIISARLMLEASDVAFEASLPVSLGLPPDIEATLALVLREAVTNIHRHAKARNARVVVSHEPGRFCMQIHDDGRGGLGAHGNGLAGMRERVQGLGGLMQIDSPPRRGTAIVVSVPLAVAA